MPKKVYISHQKARALCRSSATLSKVKAGFLWPVGSHKWIGHNGSSYYITKLGKEGT